MKKFLLILLISLNYSVLKAQDFDLTLAPEKGDFICLNSGLPDSYHFIFKKSRKVYYEYNLKTKKTANKYKQDEKLIDDLFISADKIQFEKMKGVEENNLSSPENAAKYSFIKYYKSDKTHKITWDTRGTDSDSAALNELANQMSSFW